MLHSLEIGYTKNDLFRIDPKSWWLVEVMMAIASWDLLRSTYDPGSDLLLFRIDMDDLIM